MDNTVLNNETKALLKKVITDLVKPKVILLLKPLVRPAVGVVVDLLNKQAARFVPDEIDVYINTAILEGYKGNYDLAAQAIGMAADELVDIPNVDDVHEKNLFVTLSQAAVQAVRVWIEKKRTEG